MSRHPFLVAAAASAVAACPFPLPPDADATGGAGLPASFVTIVSPPAGTTVSDTFDLEIAVRDPSLVVGGPSISVDGNLDTATLTVPSAPISLDSTSYPDGAHVIEVLLTANSGETHRAAVSVLFANAPFQPTSFAASKPYFKKGEVAQVTVAFTGDTSGMSLTADFSEMDPAYAPGQESVSDDGDGAYTLRYRLSPDDAAGDGEKEIRLVATDVPSGRSVRRTIPLSLRNVPPAPFNISNALFVDAPLPAGAVHPSTHVTIVSGAEQTLVPDVPSKLVLAWTSDVVVENLYVTVRNHAGYYLLPVTPGTTGQVTAAVTLPVEAQPTPERSANAVRSLSARRNSTLRSNLDDCSDPRSFSLEFGGTTLCLPSVPARKGVGRVVLRWQAPVDLDLFVTEPGGEQISYQKTISRNGGVLDVDANRDCIPEWIMERPAESIVWVEGSLAPGKYVVRVRMSNACLNGQRTTDPLPYSVPFTVTYQDCDGIVQERSETIPAGTAQGALLEPDLDYSIAGCDIVVHGSVTYKKYFPQRKLSSPAPLARTMISAFRPGAKDPLASSYTDASGRYQLAFKADVRSPYYLQVDSIREPVVHQKPIYVKVFDRELKIHSWKTKDRGSGSGLEYHFMVEDGKQATGDDRNEEDHTGAFNLLQVIGKGYEFAWSRLGKVPPFNLNIHWDSGYHRTTANQGGSRDLDAMYVNGSPFDPDEFDDSIILHEFYHSVLRRASRYDSSDEDHNSKTRVHPRLAWIEGAATFLACLTNDSPVIYDDFGKTPPKDSKKDEPLKNVENWYDRNTRIIAGTSNGTALGDLSEALVYSLLWDLHDGRSKGEPFDLIDNQTQSVIQSIFEYIPQKVTPNDGRGLPGAELVDFLDGFRCQSYTDAGGFGDETALKELVKVHYSFPYDFATDLKCK